MDLTQPEKDLLKLLAEEWEDAGPPGYVETTSIAVQLNISIEEAKTLIRSLFIKGMVDTDKVDTFAAYLTPEGYELAIKR